MAIGISPKLPLQENYEDGKYALNKTLKSAIAQNLKNLILTIPGERIMEPEFGVGLRTYLFKENLKRTYEEIEAKVFFQVDKYMPFVKIDFINFLGPEDDPVNISSNTLFMQINYNIIPLGASDILELSVSHG